MDIAKPDNPRDIHRAPPGAFTTCKKFAQNAVLHNDWQIKQGCGYTGPEWSADLKYHEDRCLRQDVPRKEFRERQEKIAECICNLYAQSAVAQNKENIALGCGYGGPRWSSQHDHHYSWCARGRGNIIASGSWSKFKLDRDNDLANCKKPLAAINLKPNAKTVRKGIINLLWDDAANKKARTAESFDVEVIINGKVAHNGSVKQSFYTIREHLLPYSARVTWKVRAQNTGGYSSWASALFQVENEPKPQKPQKNGPGKLNGGYRFDTVGYQPSDVTVTFNGRLISATGSSGKKTFSITKTQRVSPGGPATVSFAVAGLMRGTWSVTALSQIVGAPVTCEARVPGLVELSVAGGRGPSCRRF